MNKKATITFIYCIGVFALLYGGQDQKKETLPTAPTQGETFTIIETMNSGGYTYASLETENGIKWVAGPQTELTAGGLVTVGPSFLMKDYHSKTMDRTFAYIFFCTRLEAPVVKGAEPAKTDILPHNEPVVPKKERADLSNIQKAEGGLTVAEIFSQKAALAEKEVLIRGVAVKVSNGIMGKNWVHIQDGSGGEKTFDLMVTTQDKVEVQSIVLVKGIVRVGKDFGYGYNYDVMLEEATFTLDPR